MNTLLARVSTLSHSSAAQMAERQNENDPEKRRALFLAPNDAVTVKIHDGKGRRWAYFYVDFSGACTLTLFEEDKKGLPKKQVWFLNATFDLWSDLRLRRMAILMNVRVLNFTGITLTEALRKVNGELRAYGLAGLSQ